MNTRMAELYLGVTTQAQYDTIARILGRTGGAFRTFLLTEPGRITAAPGIRTIAALPMVWREDEDGPNSLSAMNAALSCNCDGFLVRTLEELEMVRETGSVLIADHSLYAWNRLGADLILSDCSRLVLPLELNQKELSRTFGEVLDRCILMAYGRIPMMVSAGCVKKTAGQCRRREEYFWYLKDRKGETLPVRTVCDSCYNVIYNSVPLSLHNMRGGLLMKCPNYLLSFTTESAGETEEILTSYLEFLAQVRTAAEAGADGKDISVPLPAALQSGAFTTGHYRKGAE